jgi:hypothetical protein
MKPSLPFCAALDREVSVAVVLDGEGIICYLNRAWSVSAERDGAPPACRAELLLGRRYLDFVSGELRPHLAQGFERAARLGPGVRSVWLHGECNTPHLFRRLLTRISSLWQPGEDTPAGYLVHNGVLSAGPLSERYTLVERPVDAWRDGSGMIVLCGCCRRVRDPASSDWAMSVELLERHVDGTSHGLCELCLDTYYAEALLPVESVSEATERSLR